jgi:homogentisate solanesyltransferase
VADLVLESFILKDVWSVDRYYAWMCAVEGKQVVAPVLLECGYYDVEQLEWLTQRLLVILGTACVEKTAGDLFSQPAAVVPDVKKEMLEYLNSQSEAYASGSGVVSSQGVNQVLAPSKVLDDIFEGFVRSKKTLYSRMSSKIMYSEKREEKIEDFAQELDRTGVWMVGRREVTIF